MEYRQRCYLFQYPSKVAAEKILFEITKNNDKEIVLVIADVKLMTKEFQKH